MQHIKTQSNQNLVKKDYSEYKRILSLKCKGFFALVCVHTGICCVQTSVLAKDWVEVVSLLWWMLQSAAQVITQASRHVVRKMLSCCEQLYATHRTASQYLEKEPPQTSTKEQRRGHSPGCFTVTRNPTSQFIRTTWFVHRRASNEKGPAACSWLPCGRCHGQSKGDAAPCCT